MLNKNLLLNLIKGMQNVSVSGNTDIKVLSNISIQANNASICIQGKGVDENEDEINDNFSINLKNINYINTFCGTLELCTNNGLILIEEF